MKKIIWGVHSGKPSITEYLINRYRDGVLFVVDKNLGGGELLGKAILEPSRIRDYAPGEVQVIIATERHIGEIKEQARAYGHEAVSVKEDLEEEYTSFRLSGFPQDEAGFTPRILSINFTEECNLRCVWCYFHGVAGRAVNTVGGEGRRDISDEALARILESVRTIPSIRVLQYSTAGELFTNNQWFERVSAVLDAMPNIEEFILTTNGMLLNEENVGKLTSLKVPHITLNVSIDGLSPAETEKYRVGSSYERIKKNLRALYSKVKDSGRWTITLQSYHPLRKDEDPSAPFKPKYLLNDFPDLPCGVGIVFPPRLPEECGRDGYFAEYGMESILMERYKGELLCPIPFEQIYFDCMGNMRMCPCGQFSREIIIGKAGGNALETWRSSAIMQRVRDDLSHFKPSPHCGHCPSQDSQKTYYLKYI